ncbi:hypothetical protein CPC08DRAFT_771735 [Agrocybe pediades]|nr:hypothetical protein CPC08DRAFT_771735 [Agrocybe pediades]
MSSSVPCRFARKPTRATNSSTISSFSLASDGPEQAMPSSMPIRFARKLGQSPPILPSEISADTTMCVVPSEQHSEHSTPPPESPSQATPTPGPSQISIDRIECVAPSEQHEEHSTPPPESSRQRSTRQRTTTTAISTASTSSRRLRPRPMLPSHPTSVHEPTRSRSSTQGFVCRWISCNSPAFSTKERLAAHLVKKHDVPRSNSSVLRHVLSHAVTYRCPVEGCGTEAQRLYPMNLHMKDSHPGVYGLEALVLAKRTW